MCQEREIRFYSKFPSGTGKPFPETQICETKRLGKAKVNVEKYYECRGQYLRKARCTYNEKQLPTPPRIAEKLFCHSNAACRKRNKPFAKEVSKCHDKLEKAQGKRKPEGEINSLEAAFREALDKFKYISGRHSHCEAMLLGDVDVQKAVAAGAMKLS